MVTLRSFIAIPLPEELRQKLGALQRSLRQELPELRIGASHNLHLTLLFLGNQNEEQLAKIGRFVLSVANSQASLILNIQGIGTFPKGKRARVLWAGVTPAEPLLNLQQKLSKGLIQYGYPEESVPYQPHLTLGRFRRPPADIGILQNWQDIDFGPTPVKNIVLYSSRLTPQGAVHQPLTVAEFQTP